MKILAVAISQAFLGASYSVNGVQPGMEHIDHNANAGMCSEPIRLDSCPPADPSFCTYESFPLKDPKFVNTIKRSCIRRETAEECKELQKNENECLRKGCTWIYREPKQKGA
ncbi:hypothetical protein O0I10_010047 [Lichtheimia ornata]|uniref:Uncharacterized protein n=1 Tax=Lichtheimia ornata TaxID=688661 RepID=A0AAD7XVJ1_9FUNG|nr:uncharacterized protein O0I10_010047 [Lichtheimia ornata]KAJ8654351.1 hypothetical protein O0I10_010047 [Lichtheimia ornata]